MSVIKLLAGLTVLAVMSTVTITDPTGDSVGDGTIVAPTAPRYANSAIFDLHDVNLDARQAVPGGSIILLPSDPPDADSSDEESAGADVARPEDASGMPADVHSVLEVTLGAIDVSETTTLGFGSVVVDVYLDGAPGGRETTLDGPSMLLPAGRAWGYAVRLTPDGATGFRYVAPPESQAIAVPLDTADGDPDAEGDETGGEPRVEAESVDYVRVPVGVSLAGSTLSITMPWEFTGEVTVFALTGVHDPFNPTGWRPLAATPSPWAYSGGEQVVPVIDLLAPDQGAQVRALRTGILPLPTVPLRDTGVLWLTLMALGVLVAGAGVLLRRRVPAADRKPLRTGLPPETVGEPTVPAARPAAAVAPAPADVGPTAPATGESPAAARAEPSGAASDEPSEPVRDVPPAPAAAEPLAATNGEPPEAEPASSGVSAFDSFVLVEAGLEEDDDDATTGFDDPTRAS